MKNLDILFSLIIAILLTANIVVAQEAVGVIGAGASPGDQTPRICVSDRQVNVNGINMLPYRTGQYAFMGEEIIYRIVVRDPNGVADIGQAKMGVDSQPQVLCTEIGLPETCDGMGDMNEDTDKAFECTLTVEPSWFGEKDVKVTAYNSANQPTDGTHVETWFFNPSISMNVFTSDGGNITFEPLPYGADEHDERWVHSTNRLVVINTAQGGVNLWMYIAGTDLYDPSGGSLCPTSNVLQLHGAGQDATLDTDEVLPGTDDTGMAFRGWTGTVSGEWRWMSLYDQNDGCEDITITSGDLGTCYGGKPVPSEDSLGQEALGNLLTNGGRLEVEFKLNYPMPCIGTFSQGQIMVFGKAV